MIAHVKYNASVFKKGAIVFTGSSIIAMWENLSSFFPDENVINTAISGSQTADLLPLLDDLVIKHRPRLVSYYCGSNDINYAVPPAKIAENVVQTFDFLRNKLPDLLFVYLSIIRAPQKVLLMDQVDEANSLMMQMAVEYAGFNYLDINPVFYTTPGSPRLEFFVEDGLHLTQAAYQALGEYLAPRVLILAG